MKKLWLACLLMNAIDAVGTWFCVAYLHCAHEVNPLVMMVVGAVGWQWAMLIKIALGSLALNWLYTGRHYKPVAVKRVFIFLTICFCILLGSQLLAIILSLTL